MEDSVELVLEYAKSQYSGLVDCSDVKGDDLKCLTRYLAAFTISRLAKVPQSVAANSVTDGYDDLGIDAFLFDSNTRNAWVVQSKIKQKGKGSPDQGDILKLVRGIEKLLSGDLSKANQKLQAKQTEVDAFIAATDTKLNIVIAVTAGELSPNTTEPLSEFLADQNREEQWVFIHEITLDELKDEVSRSKSPEKITLEIGLSSFGAINEPYNSVYGRVDVSSVAEWYRAHGTNLFAENIRLYLGGGVVNDRIVNTLKQSPQNFFYMNNGITVLADSVEKTRKFGKTRTDIGEFRCTNIRIINGAQTVGSIGSLLSSSSGLADNASVLVRIVSLEDAPENLNALITVASNTQNQIDAMDFASMDVTQIRLENEFLREYGWTYVRMRGFVAEDQETAVDIAELTEALIAYQDNIGLVVDYKREKTKNFWGDINAEPYTKIFNSNLSVQKSFNAAKVQKLIDSILKKKRESTKDKREKAFSQSGNLFLAHIVFNSIKEKEKHFASKESDFEKAVLSKVSVLVDEVYSKCWSIVQNENEFKKRQVARLFITRSLVDDLKSTLVPKLVI